MRIENNPVDYFLDAFEKCYPEVAKKIKVYFDYSITRRSKSKSRTIYNEQSGTRIILICPRLPAEKIIEVLADKFSLALNPNPLDASVLQKVRDEMMDRVNEEIVNKMME